MIPDEGCVLQDRAVIVEPTGRSPLFTTAMAALENRFEVILRVNGCTIIDPGQPDLTAPKVTKIVIFGP